MSDEECYKVFCIALLDSKGVSLGSCDCCISRGRVMIIPDEYQLLMQTRIDYICNELYETQGSYDDDRVHALVDAMERCVIPSIELSVFEEFEG